MPDHVPSHDGVPEGHHAKSDRKKEHDRDCDLDQSLPASLARRSVLVRQHCALRHGAREGEPAGTQKPEEMG